MDECFICCSSDGKTEQEMLMEYFSNKKTHGYPLIKLSNVYNCKCSNTQAHNKCLLNINKCPTCRKNSQKPNLYVTTKYDYYFYWLFNLLQSKPKIIKQIKTIATLIIVLMIVFVILVDKKIITPTITNTIVNTIVLVTLLLVQIIGGIVIVMEDYFKKYWLYDDKTHTIKSL